MCFFIFYNPSQCLALWGSYRIQEWDWQFSGKLRQYAEPNNASRARLVQVHYVSQAVQITNADLFCHYYIRLITTIKKTTTMNGTLWRMEHFDNLKILCPAFVVESVFTMNQVTINMHSLQEQKRLPSRADGADLESSHSEYLWGLKIRPKRWDRNMGDRIERAQEPSSQASSRGSDIDKWPDICGLWRTSCSHSLSLWLWP